MNAEERMMARKLFENKILLSDGVAFQDLVNRILGYDESDFLPIKPWGNIGDRKNDGCVPSKGIYYQVYAPEDLDSKNKYKEAITKVEKDFAGLLSHYTHSLVKKYYFVVNDKYKGVHPDIHKVMLKIKDENDLEETKVLCAKDLEDILFNLADDKILAVVGMFPDPSKMKILNYTILDEVVNYIMTQPIQSSKTSNFIVPDWDEKIEFNGLSKRTADFLNSGMIHVGTLDEYLKNNSNYAAEKLRNHLYNVYYSERMKEAGDDLFYAVLSQLSHRQELQYQNTVLVIMAKYFETCDIFEEPNKGKKQ